MFRPLLLAALLAAPAAAQHARLTVIHGIPGLPAPVEVFANNNRLFSFDFNESRGPLDLPPATYNLEVRLNGNPVLNAPATVQAGRNYTIVAHPGETTGNRLSIFENDINTLAAGQARLTVRHTAGAPAVDVPLSQGATVLATFRNLTNGNEAKADVPAGAYSASILAAGTTTVVVGPVPLQLDSRISYLVHAIGRLSDSSFRLFVQTINLNPPFVGFTVEGTSCGGAIGASVGSTGFGQDFDAVLLGGTPSSMAMLIAGTSNTSISSMVLPYALDSFGAPGCFLFNDAAVVFPMMTSATGGASVRLQVPLQLAGAFPGAYLQYAFVNAQANALGLQFTNQLRIEERR